MRTLLRSAIQNATVTATTSDGPVLLLVDAHVLRAAEMLPLEKRIRSAVAVIALMSGVYVTVYVATSWHMADLIHASASRLLLHLIGPALFILGSAAGHYFPVRAKSMNPLSTSTDSSLT